MRRILILLLLVMHAGQKNSLLHAQRNILVLGVAQDGGYPHIGCRKTCCNLAWQFDSLRRNVVSLAVVDSVSKKWWLVEATPDITAQLHLFDSLTSHQYPFLPEGIFITHAHIGHYTGLMQLGKEALNAKEIPVYCLPGMKHFLESNGPWSQLVSLHNIQIRELQADSLLKINDRIQIIAWIVPHRDEFSETAGFKITAGNSNYLFIPDIDKWEKWNHDIVYESEQCDVAFLDGTFFTENELPGRNLEEIPHPTIKETKALSWKSIENTSKIHFIHFNHTNKLLWQPNVGIRLRADGFRFAVQGQWY